MGVEAGDFGILLLLTFESSFEFFVEFFFLLLVGKLLSIGLYELKCVCLRSSDVDLFICGFRLAKENVLLDCRVEQDRLLHDVAALLPKLMHIILIKVVSIDEDLSRRYVVEPEKNVRQSTLSTP